NQAILTKLNRKTSIEQMVVDVKTIKVNLSKTPMELNGHRIQNESEEGDSTLKRSKTTCLRIEELLKLLSSYKKENYTANSTLMEIDPNKVSSKINMKINPMQGDEITVPEKQTNNQNAEGKRIVIGSNAIKIINRRGFSSSEDNTHFEKIKPINTCCWPKKESGNRN
ncbi:983_t:CDS:2, partial [Gigaspora margarita]